MVTRARRRRRARGLTLIEVMVALLVTTIALLGALATVGITVRGANFSRNATEASVLVQSKLESLVSLPAGTSGGALPTVTPELPMDANGNSGTANAMYTRTTTWTQTTTQRKVTVDVSWPDPIAPADPTKAHHVIASRTQDLQ
ncbi:MAG TPA: prepilin-type N-terminal cleavage/methylation domain-containing protein [Polyangia bacterium]